MCRFWAIVFLVLINGCSRLIIKKIPAYLPSDLSISQNDIGRTNSTNFEISPPLSVIWNYTASGGFGTFPASHVDDIICVGDLNGEINLLNIKTGKSLGSKKFGSTIIGTPLIDGDNLYVALSNDENTLNSYNLLKGAVNWRLALGEIETSPLIIGEKICVTTLTGKLICVEKFRGQIVWTFDPPIPQILKICHSSPASDGNLIVYSCEGGYIFALNLSDGKLSWQTNIGSSIISSPAIYQNRVFIGSLDSSFYSFDLSTGTQIWKRSLGSSVYTSQAVSNKYVFVSTVGKSLYCLSFKDGEIIWEKRMKGLILSPPLLSGKFLYIASTDKCLSVVDVDNGKFVWQFKTEDRIKSIPLIVPGRLFLFLENRNIIALQPVGDSR